MGNKNGCFSDIESGVIQIVGEIEYELASKFRRKLNALSRTHKTITVEINSVGGCIDSGLMIIDTIRTCSSAITVLATGQAMSMAAIILVSAPKREALEYTSIMIHDGTYDLSIKFSDLQKELEEIQRQELKTYNLIDKYTKKKRGYWKNRCNGQNLYLTAEQALKEGIIDKIRKKADK